MYLLPQRMEDDKRERHRTLHNDPATSIRHTRRRQREKEEWAVGELGTEPDVLLAVSRWSVFAGSVAEEKKKTDNQPDTQKKVDNQRHRNINKQSLCLCRSVSLCLSLSLSVSLTVSVSLCLSLSLSLTLTPSLTLSQIGRQMYAL